MNGESVFLLQLEVFDAAIRAGIDPGDCCRQRWGRFIGRVMFCDTHPCACFCADQMTQMAVACPCKNAHDMNGLIYHYSGCEMNPRTIGSKGRVQCGRAVTRFAFFANVTIAGFGECRLHLFRILCQRIGKAPDVGTGRQRADCREIRGVAAVNKNQPVRVGIGSLQCAQR